MLCFKGNTTNKTIKMLVKDELRLFELSLTNIRRFPSIWLEIFTRDSTTRTCQKGELCMHIERTQLHDLRSIHFEILGICVSISV